MTKKNYPIRRWKRHKDRASLYVDGRKLTLVIKPIIPETLRANISLSYISESMDKMFVTEVEAKEFARSMTSPFEGNFEDLGFENHIHIIYN